MNKKLGTIAVDLTPVLLGGENGGAKIFVLELLHRLAEMSTSTQFILLTQSASHEELAILDRPNVRRLMVLGPMVNDTVMPLLRRLASRWLPHLPGRVRRLVERVGYKINMIIKRGGTSNSLLRGLGVDLLFCPFTAPTYFEVGIPTVCTIYDLQFKSFPEFFAEEDVAHREQTFIAACRHSTALTAISDYSRDAAILHGNLDPCQIRTIHLRMAQRITSDTKNDKGLLARYGLVSKSYLIYPANFWKHKNHEMLFTAFGIACHEELDADIKLVCTGTPGSRQQWLVNATQAMKLNDRIIFPGYLPNAELAALMENAIGMVFPSLYEGFGLPIIEAMALGVPVACSNLTSLPEVAADAAILFDPRVPSQIVHAIISLVKNESLRIKLIQAGQKRAIEFSDGDLMARQYWELFQYALANDSKEDLLTGAYIDGWVGPCLNVQVAPATGTQTFEVDFLVPEWLPFSPLTVQVICSGNQKADKLIIPRGGNAVLSLPVESFGGCFEIRISPTFIPADSGYGDDQRELSAMLQRCGVVHSDGEYVELFPGNFLS